MATRLCQAKKVEISTKKAMPIQIDGEPQEWGPGQVQCTRSTHKRRRALAPRVHVHAFPRIHSSGCVGFAEADGAGGGFSLHCFRGLWIDADRPHAHGPFRTGHVSHVACVPFGGMLCTRAPRAV